MKIKCPAHQIIAVACLLALTGCAHPTALQTQSQTKPGAKLTGYNGTVEVVGTVNKRGKLILTGIKTQLHFQNGILTSVSNGGNFPEVDLGTN